MARLRTLKPSFFTNEDLATLPPLGRLLFQGLWCLADREGRLEDRPLRIKAQVLPYDRVNVGALLDLLHEHGFIQRYAVTDGATTESYIQVVKFTKHQTPHIKEGTSTIPAPCKPDTSTGNSDASTPRVSVSLSLGSGNLSLGSGRARATRSAPAAQVPEDFKPFVEALSAFPEFQPTPLFISWLE